MGAPDHSSREYHYTAWRAKCQVGKSWAADDDDEELPDLQMAKAVGGDKPEL